MARLISARDNGAKADGFKETVLVIKRSISLAGAGVRCEPVSVGRVTRL